MTCSRITTALNIEEALSWLNEYGPQGGVVLAGGTDLFVGWSTDIPKPQHILYIGELKDLRGIKLQYNELRIGPLTSMSDIAKSTLVMEKAPALARAAGAMGSPLIRERATIGGNLCHASPAADTAAPLLAYGTELELRDDGKSRWILLEHFFTGPGETARSNTELLTNIRIPVNLDRLDFYLRLGQRRALACVKVSVAGSAILENHCLQHVGIALGAVAPVPVLARNTMAILEGSEPTDSVIDQAAKAAMAECNPIDDIRSTVEYRRTMVGELLKNGLESLRRGNNNQL